MSDYPKEMLAVIFIIIVTVLQLAGFFGVSLLLNYAESRQRYLKPKVFAYVLIVLAVLISILALLVGVQINGW